MKQYVFFDNASTTKCCEAAAELVQRFAIEDFGNPSSSHAFGVQAAKAISDSRKYFGTIFGVSADQIIFTGSGSESDNLAVYGVAMSAFIEYQVDPANKKRPRVITSKIEHAAVKKSVQSLADFGIDVQFAPVGLNGQVLQEELAKLLTPETVLVSIQQVNNILGSINPVEQLAQFIKSKVPGCIFHTDAVQAFGRVPHPMAVAKAPNAIDLVSISAHKVQGPKGVGALVVLNRDLLKKGLRPLIWGGEQEGGFRSGTQNAGLIAGFHAAAKQTLEGRESYATRMHEIRAMFRAELVTHGLLNEQNTGKLRWNSPQEGVPQIVSLSAPGYPSALLAKMLEERGCLVSTGSACSSQKPEPDPVLGAAGFPTENCTSAVRISFGCTVDQQEISHLAEAFAESLRMMTDLLGLGRG